MSASLIAKKLRLPLGFLIGALYLWKAPEYATTERLVIGAAIAFVGVLVRAWAAGHIIKNNRLATTGPYAHVRNPLYFGSFLIACGFAIAAHPVLLVFVALFWGLIYFPTMQRERRNILGRFPDAYPEFERHVPLFIPRVTPWRQQNMPAEDTRWSWPLFLKHGEWKAALVWALAIAWIAVRMGRHTV